METNGNGSQAYIITNSQLGLELDPKDEKDKNENEPKKRNLIFWKCLVFGVFSGYFLWATIYYVQDLKRLSISDSACSGYGCLMILYIFILYGITYTYIIKPYLEKHVLKFLVYPITSCLKKIKYIDQLFSAAFFLGVFGYLIFDTSDNRSRLMPISGLLVFLLIGFLMSNNKKKIPWHTVLWGLKLQFIFGFITIRWNVGRQIFSCIGDKITTFLHYSQEGAKFVYGDTLVLGEINPETNVRDLGGVFAFSGILTVYFMAFMINILYYYGIMQKVVKVIGEFLQMVMDTTICESVNTAANIFLGMTEAPLLLKPYLKNLTNSEINSIMTSGFATVAGSVMAAYISYGADPAALITASVMSAPAALCFSKMMVPETEEVKITKENVDIVENEYESVLDAASQGVSMGLQIVLGICSSVIAFIAFVAFINGILGWMGILVGFSGENQWSLDLIAGKIFIPVSYIMGVPWEDCEKVGKLIGLKTMINEFVAYKTMGEMNLTGRTKMIATYAICGFSNPGSVGILISAMVALIPHKKQAILKTIYKSFIGGALVCFMTACIASMLYPEIALQ
ncbi:unnamed protein product [Brassicogethes aeneus]|uniref:Sodium/nucleoside cotransporter n=1 Tax=Brassicogethes aeneus TaxID=1431903 RepID=A0A9P0AWL1_BRAAE|nr:unnamed protein product [Brassicogethes aeneus]